MADVIVHKPGMLSTVQDLGRWGYQSVGVPVAGPMDEYSHRLANRLVGNPDHAATLEVTVIGPDLAFDGEVTFAVAGAEFPLELDGVPVAGNVRCRAASGSRLRFGVRSRGARAYLAVAGGLDLPPVMGSRSESVISGVGPLGGRALAAGDRLPVGGAAAGVAETGRPLALPDGGARLRILWGPQADRFTPEARATVVRARYTVSPQSNRMGYRLTGDRLSLHGEADILSEATPMGSVQVPGSGEPILLMADRQTAGGYAKIATVIGADLPLAGQLEPGDWIEFTACDLDAARAARAEAAARLHGRGRP